jgi:metal-responsive CopG/Arc/MetJ family transcriptional regulator
MKISVSLPRDLVAAVDDQARQAGPPANRSAVIEAWLRQGARRHEEQRLEDEVVAYYRSLDSEARAEDRAIGKATSRAARRLTIDESPRSRHGRR